MPDVDPTTIINQLWSQKPPDAKLYALLDAACDEQIYAEVSTLAQGDYHCLFEGQWAQELAQVAPYLVELQQNAAFTRNLVAQGWGKSWGVFLASSAGMNDLLSHLRRLLMVTVESDPPQSLYFRFYDPGVLRTYLANCNESELHQMFGAVIACYWVENETGDALVAFPASGTIHSIQEADVGLTLHDKHMNALLAQKQQEIEQHIYEQLQEFWPEACTALGEDGVVSTIQKGLTDCAEYGFETEYDICRYINIMYALGYDFDTKDDNALWVQDFLYDTRFRATTRMTQLCEQVSKKLEQEDAEKAFHFTLMNLANTPGDQIPIPAQQLICPLQETWIEIELILANGEPASYEPYEVTCSSNKVYTGILDEQGYARIVGLEQIEDCVVRFPNVEAIGEF